MPGTVLRNTSLVLNDIALSAERISLLLSHNNSPLLSVLGSLSLLSIVSLIELELGFSPDACSLELSSAPSSCTRSLKLRSSSTSE